MFISLPLFISLPPQVGFALDDDRLVAMGRSWPERLSLVLVAHTHTERGTSIGPLCRAFTHSLAQICQPISRCTPTRPRCLRKSTFSVMSTATPWDSAWMTAIWRIRRVRGRGSGIRNLSLLTQGHVVGLPVTLQGLRLSPKTARHPQRRCAQHEL
ncbi:hypothetical protein C8R43DRAFT_610469 [Mycena crocata]|nr:hypothetical protein C8R43DRAFT_610469 [Mycena crocata]